MDLLQIITLILYFIYLLVHFGNISLIKQFCRYVEHELDHKSYPNYTPRATVILPCKGLDQGFEENVKALLSQNYPDYETIFSLYDRSDPAWSVLERICRENKGRAKLVYGSEGKGVSQKLANQINALEKKDSSSEVLVFMDADNCSDPEYLQRLIAPLSDDHIGATTGFRWLKPLKENHYLSILVSLWHLPMFLFLTHPKFNFAWGGAMACKTEIFQRAGIQTIWKKALIDDFTFTKAIKKLGLKVKFVPLCIGITEIDYSFKELLDFTNRQCFVLKNYDPAWFWIANSLFLSKFILIFLLFFIVIIDLSSLTLLSWINRGLLVSLFLFEIVGINYLLNAVDMIFKKKGFESGIEKLRIKYFIALLPACVLYAVNWLNAIISKKYRWRGVVYLVHDPYDIEKISQGVDGSSHIMNEEVSSAQKQKEEHIRLYNKLGKNYDFYGNFRTIFLGGVKSMHRQIFSNIMEDVNGEVLELCCGTGGLTVFLAQSNKISNISAVDFSAEEINIAKKRATGHKVLFSVGDATNLKLKKKFDSVLICQALHEMNSFNIRAILKEASRVLENDGNLILIEPKPPKNRIVRFVFNYLCLRNDERASVYALHEYGLGKYLSEQKFQVKKNFVIFSDTMQIVIANKK